MTKHYRYSPSATKRWLNCTASLDAPASKDSVWSEEGHLAHAVGEQAVRTGVMPDDIGDEEFRAAIKLYVDYVDTLRAEKRPMLELIEDTRVHKGFDDYGGTADYLAIYEELGLGVLHFVDYKHGAGIPVTAEENAQLLSYADIFGSWFGPAIDVYRLTIVQPRCLETVAPVQTWDTTPERVAEHAKAVVDVRSQHTLKAGDWCRFCSLASTCPALRERTLEIAKLQFEQADTDELLQFYSMAEVIRSALSELESVLIEKARLGCELPGYKIVESVGKRKWSEPEDKIFRRLRKLGISKKQATATKILSPTAVEKLLPKDVRKQALNGLIVRESIGLRVVPETARGLPMSLSVEQVFKDDPV